MSTKATTQPAALPPRLGAILLLAWLVPGAGHLLLRQRGRAAVLALGILGLFVFGLLLRGGMYAPLPAEPLTFLGAAGTLGVGASYFIAQYAGLAAGQPIGRGFEYGRTFTLIAGLLNILALLDVYDLGTGRKGGSAAE
ncbi:MAG TPA: DUF6677 family protein [Acidobacteriota bacterium]